MENKRKARDLGGIRWKNFARNWAHQGYSYMDSTERNFRMFVEVSEVLLVLFLLQRYIFVDRLVLSLILAIAVVHTFNWITNCLFWCIVLFGVPGQKNRGKEKTVEYLDKMAIRLRGNKSVVVAAIYGSLSRGAWTNNSDIDIRFLREAGFTNGILASLVVMRERFLAFIHKQPVDLFLADSSKFLEKMKKDEVPIVIKSTCLAPIGWGRTAVVADESIQRYFPGEEK